MLKTHDRVLKKFQVAKTEWIRDSQAEIYWYNGEDLTELEDLLRQYYIATFDKASKLSDYHRWILALLGYFA